MNDRDILEAQAIVWRAIKELSPSAFAVAYRHLKDGTTGRPGKFSFESFEFMISILDTIEEAIRLGKRWVFMKPAQIGGSECVLCALAWVQTYFPGPTLYMTSTDDTAKRFSENRLTHMCETVEPLAKKFLPARGAARDELHMKKFVDGSIAICGGKSVNNFQSHPYRSVFIDEADELAEDLAGAGDPIKLAELRTAAYAMFGSTFVGAFAHPSTKEGPVGRLYYELSDQRRAFVRCPHCAGEFWLQRDHVAVLPRDGQSPAAAERDPTCYRYVTPCCGVELPDHERLAAAKNAVQKSTLAPEIAATKPWIGVHISHFYTKPLLELARDWVAALDRPSELRVIVNKVDGDVWEETEASTSIETWQRLATPEGEPGAYKLGTAPTEVRWLTGGQDSNARDLHWAVWGWGLVASEGGHPILCGWLIDYGCEAGPARFEAERRTLHAEDLEVFDQVLYSKLWPTVSGDRQLFVGQAFHDAGWQQVGVYEYCRAQPGRSIPSKGAALDDRSRAPAITWARSVKTKIGHEEVAYPELARADLNTFVLKLDFTGLAGKRFLDKDKVPRARLALPYDVSSEFLAHLASEKLVLEDGRRRWVKTSHENHWWDCAILAYAAALNTAPVSPSSAKVTAPSVPSRPLRERRFGGGRSNWLRRGSR